MIWDTDVNAKKNGMYEDAIKNLEKAKQILDDRLSKGTVSDSEYATKMKELDAQIQKYKSMMGAL